MISQRIVTFQAQIAALQAGSAQSGSAPAAANPAANAQEGMQDRTHERARWSGAMLGRIIDTQA